MLLTSRVTCCSNDLPHTPSRRWTRPSFILRAATRRHAISAISPERSSTCRTTTLYTARLRFYRILDADLTREGTLRRQNSPNTGHVTFLFPWISRVLRFHCVVKGNIIPGEDKGVNERNKRARVLHTARKKLVLILRETGYGSTRYPA